MSTERRDAGERQINGAFRRAGYSDGQVLEGDCNRASRVFYRALRDNIRALGTCAYDNDDGKRADAIHVVLPDGQRALDHHLLNFGGCRVRLASSENYKGDWSLSSTHPTSSPPPGSSPPTTTPTPTPPPLGCVLPWSAGRWVEVGIGNVDHTPPFVSQQVTAGTKWCTERGEDRGPDGKIHVKDWPFECGTKCCRADGHEGALGLACQAQQFGAPTWKVVEGQVNLVETQNPFNRKVASGQGTIEVCGSIPNPGDGRLPCTRARVKAQPGPVIP